MKMRYMPRGAIYYLIKIKTHGQYFKNGGNKLDLVTYGLPIWNMCLGRMCTSLL